MDEPKKSGIIISINPPYTDMILSKQKPMEFRRKVLNSLLLDNNKLLPIYLYETKNHGGIGKIIGEAEVKEVFRIYYITDPTPTFELIYSRIKCIRTLYLNWFKCFSNQEKLKLNMKDSWYKDKNFLSYLKSIGWYEERNFNFAIQLTNVKRYDKPKNISDFLNKTGNPYKLPPQGMFYCYE